MRWLREPIDLRADIDWRAVGRSVGRTIGGGQNHGSDESPLAKRFADAGPEIRTVPRWAAIAFLLWLVGVFAVAIVLAAWIISSSPNS